MTNDEKRYRLTELSKTAQANAFQGWLDYMAENGWDLFEQYSKESGERYDAMGSLVETGEPDDDDGMAWAR